MVTIIRAPKGSDRREVEAETIQIPDLWHAAMWLKDTDNQRSIYCQVPATFEPMLKQWGDMVLETWHLCHDLLENILNPPA